MINPTVQSLQDELRLNMNKAIEFAEKNTIRNLLGEVVITSEELDEEDVS